MDFIKTFFKYNDAAVIKETANLNEFYHLGFPGIQ